jgi:hypothetical protein
MELSVRSGTRYPDPEDASLNTPPRQALSILVHAGAAPLLDKSATNKTKLCLKLNNGPHTKLTKNRYKKNAKKM